MHAGADPNYNTLTGCNALVNTTTFEEFIMEVEIDAVADNDGMGLGAPRCPLQPTFYQLEALRACGVELAISIFSSPPSPGWNILHPPRPLSAHSFRLELRD
jgi:hypothetical protein